MPSIYCIEECVFKKSVCKIGDFYLQLQEGNDHDKKPSENLGSQIQEQV